VYFNAAEGIDNLRSPPDTTLTEGRCSILQRALALQEVIVAAHGSRRMGMWRETERMLCDGLYVGFEGVSLAGQRAVEILPLQWLDNKGGVFERRPFASHYTEPKQPIRVDLDSLRSLTQASRVIKSIQKAVQKARAEAQAHQVVRLVVQSVVAEKADKQQRRGDCMKREGDVAIALGGEMKRSSSRHHGSRPQ
jgi:hypothetical protein